jgi:hypothetical protein
MKKILILIAAICCYTLPGYADGQCRPVGNVTGSLGGSSDTGIIATFYNSNAYEVEVTATITLKGKDGKPDYTITRTFVMKPNSNQFRMGSATLQNYIPTGKTKKEDYDLNVSVITLSVRKCS